MLRWLLQAIGIPTYNRQLGTKKEAQVETQAVPVKDMSLNCCEIKYNGKAYSKTNKFIA